MTARFTISRTTPGIPLDHRMLTTSNNRYSVEIEPAELFAKLYRFEDESAVYRARDKKPREVLIREYNGEPRILIHDYSDLHLYGTVFWESLLDTEITSIDGNEKNGETIFILHYAQEGGTLEPEDIDLQASHRFLIRRGADGLFEKLNTELNPATWFQRGCDLYIGTDEQPHKIYAIIPHDSILVNKGIPFWEEMFKIHGGMKSFP